jgi:putative ubiquitin-RnfH superfamily antitoxin RatB of RatAB toxin-antitoxin module
MAADLNGPILWVEVAYATPRKQVILRLDVPAGCTVAEAIERSGILQQFPAMKVNPDAVGVFSRKVPMDYVLWEGDRVEIYRPLIADPKETRRSKANSAT